MSGEWCVILMLKNDSRMPDIHNQEAANNPQEQTQKNNNKTVSFAPPHHSPIHFGVSFFIGAILFFISISIHVLYCCFHGKQHKFLDSFVNTSLCF